MSDPILSTNDPEMATGQSTPSPLSRWEEIKIRRLWHKLQGQFSTPNLPGLLKAEDIDADSTAYATIARIAWEEVFVLYGDKLEQYELLKEQVSNPLTDWTRVILPDIVGAPLKSDSAE